MSIKSNYLEFTDVNLMNIVTKGPAACFIEKKRRLNAWSIFLTFSNQGLYMFYLLNEFLSDVCDTGQCSVDGAVPSLYLKLISFKGWSTEDIPKGGFVKSCT